MLDLWNMVQGLWLASQWTWSHWSTHLSITVPTCPLSRSVRPSIRPSVRSFVRSFVRLLRYPSRFPSKITYACTSHICLSPPISTYLRNCMPMELWYSLPIYPMTWLSGPACLFGLVWSGPSRVLSCPGCLSLCLPLPPASGPSYPLHIVYIYNVILQYVILYYIIWSYIILSYIILYYIILSYIILYYLI